jgi:uncharacterized repeat protein (TIGR01451 family)
VDNSDANGGAAGTGLVDISGLSLAGIGDTVLIEFEVELAPVIANDTFVYNQSQASFAGFTIAVSDDPNQNPPPDPMVAGDEDPTQILIQSAPAFDIDKISTYIDGDPAVLLAGETLRYTITVQNVGTENATGVDITDAVPANTTYVADSTTLNGAPVADAAGGASPLINGIQVYAPQDTTPGNMNAAVADNLATITFDVVVYPDAPDGTIIRRWSTTRPATSSATSRCCLRRRARPCKWTSIRTASSIRATRCATPSPSTTTVRFRPRSPNSMMTSRPIRPT